MLVTGGDGFLGRHLAEATDAGGWEWVAPPSHRRSTCATASRCSTTSTTWRPNVVVHLAYRKRRPRARSSTAARTSPRPPQRARARLIHLSTDVVFAGRERPYTEPTSPTPIARLRPVEGRGRAACRRRCTVGAAAAHLAAVRHRPPRSVAARRPRPTATITWFTDEFRCPAHAADVAAAICTLADRRDVIGPLHVAGPEAVSRAGLAQAIAGWLGLVRRRGAHRVASSTSGARPARPRSSWTRRSAAATRHHLPPGRRGPALRRRRSSATLDPDGQAPLIVTSRMTRLTPAARIGSQSTSSPTSTTSSSIRCRVEAMVNSRTGPPS